MYHRAVFLLLLMTFLLGCYEITAEQKEPTMQAYSSPNAVFDAYRQAYQRRDWRTLYFLFTPKVQRDMVFEAYFACGELDDPKLKAVQKTFGCSEAALRKRYLEEYKRKHGHNEEIDKYLAEIEKATADAESNKRGAEPTKKEISDMAPSPAEAAVNALPNDEDLLRQVLYDLTKDKVGFFTAVQEVLEKRRKLNVIGDLEEVTIKGDTATGRAKITIVPKPGESPPKVDKIDKTFKFRRVDGGWLLDSQ